MTSLTRIISAPLASLFYKKSTRVKTVKWLTVAMVVLGGVAANAQVQVTNTFTTAGTATWTCPSGITSVQVQAWGGGGGAGGAGANYASTGGGAGGSYVEVTSVPVTAGTTYQLTVGAGGAGGAGGAAGTGTTGVTGGSSYFGNSTAGSPTGASILAVGGPGSIGNNAAGSSTSNRTVTAGATGTNSGNIPSTGAAVNVAGGNGATPVTNANNSGAGGNVGGYTSGTAGKGGAGLTSAGATGNAGNPPGGGGGGADQSSSASNGVGGSGAPGEVAITFTPTSATILVSGSLSGVSTVQGTASPTTSFSVQGVMLSGNIVITPPSGFEISTTAGSGYSTSLSLTPTSGTVSPTTIYVRLAATTLAGTYSGNITLASTGASTVTEPTVPSTVVSAPFTAGNLAVEQLPTNGTSSVISIVELSPTTANQTSPVNSITIPSTGASPLRQSNAGSTGRLATSNDGTLLAFSGFEDPTGVADETATTLRGAASLNSNYQYVLQASYNDSAGSGDQTRGATFNNSTWYMSDKNGIWLNNATSAANTTNVRPIKSFGGTVYAMSANATAVVSSVSTNGATLTGLAGLPADASSVDFYMLSSGENGATFDTIYVMDGTSISKYAFSSATGSWTATGTASLGTLTGDGFYAVNNGTVANLYFTTGSGDTVNEVTDTAGYNQAPNINVSNAITVYTGPTGDFLKGVAPAPLAAAQADLTIGVSGPGNVQKNTNFTYTLTAANSGAASASGVSFEFTLPAGVSFVSAADGGSGGFTPSESTNAAGQTVVKFAGGTLAVNASDAKLTVVATAANAGVYTVDAGNSTSTTDGSAAINTSATTSSPVAESNTANDYPNVAVVTVVSLPDLTASISTTATFPYVNTQFTYTLTVSNIGNANASGLPVTFTLPAGLTYVSASETTANFTATAPTVTTSNGQQTVNFTGGTLNQSSSDTITVTVTGSTPGTYTVAAGAVVVDPGNVVPISDPTGNASTGTPSVSVTAASLVVNTTPMPNSAIAPGATGETFDVYVSNVSATTAGVTNGSTVTITDTLPSGLTPTAASGSGWTVTISGQTITATRSDVLNPGAGYPPLVITYSVASNASGTVTNTVSVSGGGSVSTNNDSGNFGAQPSSSSNITVGTATPLVVPGQLIVTRGHYLGTSSSPVVAGQTLPNGSTASVSSAYPQVWSDEAQDVSFGITAPIYMDVINSNLSSPVVSTNLSGINVTSLIQQQLGLAVSTSFSSKSELGIIPTPDGKGVTMVGYMAPANTLDVSNSNEPYLIDPTNLIAANGQYQHAVVQMDYLGNVQVTPIDAYSGDNCRGAILAQAPDGNSYYYTAGSAGNSGTGVTGAIMSLLANYTGIQMILPGAGGLTTAVGQPYGTYGSSTGYQRGYAGQPTDKTGKDMNLRGLAFNPFNSTLYSSKGSGGSGVDTVYQIGSGLQTPSSASTATFTIPTGFPTTSNGHFPFGMWFASPSVMYVADEGEVPPSPATYDTGSGTYDEALPANNALAGLQKWVNSAPNGTGTWTLAYTLQNGLNLGVPYSYAIGNGYPAPGTINSATGVPWQPANNGLRTFAAKLNGDGTATFYAVTSTVSGETDAGADPNQLVTITDNVAATSLPVNESFSVLEEAGGLDCLRGVSLFQGAPVNPVTATSITASGATLNGEVNPNGTDTQAYFQYGTTTSYGSTTTAQDLGSGTSPASFSSAALTGLQAGTVYYYRLVTVANGVTTDYANQSFTTAASVPAGPATDTPTMPPVALVMLALAFVAVSGSLLKRQTS